MSDTSKLLREMAKEARDLRPNHKLIEMSSAELDVVAAELESLESRLDSERLDRTREYNAVAEKLFAKENELLAASHRLGTFVDLVLNGVAVIEADIAYGGWLTRARLALQEIPVENRCVCGGAQQLEAKHGTREVWRCQCGRAYERMTEVVERQEPK